METWEEALEMARRYEIRPPKLSPAGFAVVAMPFAELEFLLGDTDNPRIRARTRWREERIYGLGGFNHAVNDGLASYGDLPVDSDRNFLFDSYWRVGNGLCIELFSRETARIVVTERENPKLAFGGLSVILEESPFEMFADAALDEIEDEHFQSWFPPVVEQVLRHRREAAVASPVEA